MTPARTHPRFGQVIRVINNGLTEVRNLASGAATMGSGSIHSQDQDSGMSLTRRIAAAENERVESRLYARLEL